jgi:hypothetical protein
MVITYIKIKQGKLKPASEAVSDSTAMGATVSK